MNVEPFNWNVVVLGAWNRAIFTPQWIAQYIFCLKEAEAVTVEVPLSTPLPWRIKHEDVAVVVGAGSLEVVADSCAYEALDKARTHAIRAIDELPRTPLSAAGFNIRYRAEESSTELAEILASPVDNLIADVDLDILGRAQHRSVAYKDGIVNIDMRVDRDGGAIVQFNFHLASDCADKLKEWLRVPVEDVRKTVQSILDQLPGDTVQ